MKGLDLRKLSKVSSDDHATIFKHDMGHELKIAHAGLSPQMLKEVQNLSVKGMTPKKMAKGGDPLPEPSPQPDQTGGNSDQQQNKSPVVINVASPGGNPTPSPNVSSPLPAPQNMAGNGPALPNGGMVGQQLDNYIQQNPGPMATTGNNPNTPSPTAQDVDQKQDTQDEAAATQAAPVQQSQEQSPAQPVAAAAQAPVAPPTFEQLKDQTKQDLSKEDLAWQQDLANGHITPETYQSLFEKKDTLGKIGTIFGLLVGGAGAGLSHQPNALLSMMDKEIDNDLKAQTTSKANAQNFLRLNQQNALTKAQAGYYEQEAALRAAQIPGAQAEAKLAGAKIPQIEAETKEAQARAGLTGAQTKATTFATAQAQMLQSSYHHLVQQVSKMPEGPQKEAAKMQLGMMYSKIADKINNINDQAAGADAFAKMLYGNNGGTPGSEQQFQQNTSMLPALGPLGEKRKEDLESKHIPGFQGQASAPMQPQEKKELNTYVDFDQSLGRLIDWSKQNSGILPDSPANFAKINQGKVLAQMAAAKYRESQLNTIYRPSEAPLLNQAIDPDPAQFLNKWRSLPKLEAIRQENQSQLNTAAKEHGFAGYKGTGETPQYKTVNGVKYMRGPNGEAIKVQ